MIYLIGSLANPEIPKLATLLRGKLGVEVFDDWHGAGEEADRIRRDYERARGRSFPDALASPVWQSIFNLDKEQIDRASTVVLVLPAGKSGHLEFGYAIGRGKRGYILLDGEPERYDVMYGFASRVLTSKEELMLQIAADERLHVERKVA